LSGWWAVWVLSNIVANISIRMDLRGDYDLALQLGLLAHFGDLILYPLAYLLVQRITAAQAEGRMSGAIFA
jgi:hypothetical protein